MWALANSFVADESSALSRSLYPDRKRHDELMAEIAADQVNAIMYVAHTLALIFSNGKGEKPKYAPIRTYPGSPFEVKKKVQMINPAAALGGYRKMSLDQARVWAKSLGVPVS